MQKIRDVDVKWGETWLRGRIASIDEQMSYMVIQLFPEDDEPVPHMVVVGLASEGKAWKEIEEEKKA